MIHDWPTLLRRAELAQFAAELLPKDKCHGTTVNRSTGESYECGAQVVPGLDSCWWHAGTNRDEALLERGLLRVAEARSLLSEAAPQAAARLAHVAIEGEKDRDAITAATQLLDRIGVSSRSALDVNVGGTVAHVDVTPVLGQLLERLDLIEHRRSALEAQIIEVSGGDDGELEEPIEPVPPPPQRDDEPLAEAG